MIPKSGGVRLAKSDAELQVAQAQVIALIGKFMYTHVTTPYRLTRTDMHQNTMCVCSHHMHTSHTRIHKHKRHTNKFVHSHIYLHTHTHTHARTHR